MERAAELVSKQQRYKNARNDVRKIPHTLEWLCPKQGSHVNSIDSLLHSDDLLKESSIKGKEIPRKDKFESCLQKRNVVKWRGVVKKIKSDWQGTITFNRYIDVHFVPQTRGGSRPMQPMRMHRSEFHVNLITRSRVSIETPKNNKIHNLISKCMRVVPREALLWYYRSKQ